LAQQYDYDLIILGGGSAGIVSGVVAGSSGLRTLLIEKNRLGGECLNTGCVPSKALLQAAQVAHQIRTAERFGITQVALNRHDAAGVLRHVRETIGVVEEADGSADLLRKSGVEIRFGDAAFVSPDALEFAEQGGAVRQLTAEHFLIATGSSPAVPPIPGLEEAGFLTNETVFDLDAIPESLLVIGGGPIGVEMAQAFARLGSAVTLVEQGNRLLPQDDLEAARVLEQALHGERITISLDTKILSARKEGPRKVLHIENGGFKADLSAHALLVATGRKPNTEGLHLEAARVKFDARGIHVTPTLQTTAPRIWACGDVIGRAQFSHMAEYEARLVVRNILLPFDQKTDPGYRLAPWATFTDPEVAHVGLTEEQAKEQGIAYKVYRQPFAQNDRALVSGEAVGFVKVLATGWQGKILGAHIVGPRAGELLQEWVQAMTQGISLRQVADTIHVYPTLSTANQHAAYRWYEEQANNPVLRNAFQGYTRAIRPNLGRIMIGFAGAAVIAGGVLVGQAVRRRDK
jgi:pyruvate/2-oxoglutarate dehydrogenase complex dihydrolipoamide dehydrogenase (E3) component